MESIATPTRMLRWLVFSAATLAVTAPASGQECRAGLQSQPPSWSALQTKTQTDTARMKLFTVISCEHCDPVTVIEVFAGAASASFRSMPLTQKIGIDFAEAVVSDDRERSDFLDTTLAAERQSSPGCVMDGQINGVLKIGAMGLIVTNMRVECDHAPHKLRAAFLSGYDGRCLYKIRVIWPGWAGLSEGAQDQVLEVLDQIRFGP
jgi:hypothetical protein